MLVSMPLCEGSGLVTRFERHGQTPGALSRIMHSVPLLNLGQKLKATD